jgi:hypothetical protein
MVSKLGLQQGCRSCQIRYQVVQDLGLLLGLLRHVSHLLDMRDVS